MPHEAKFGLNGENPHIRVDFFGPFRAGEGTNTVVRGHTYSFGGRVCVCVWVCERERLCACVGSFVDAWVRFFRETMSLHMIVSSDVLGASVGPTCHPHETDLGSPTTNLFKFTHNQAQRGSHSASPHRPRPRECTLGMVWVAP